MLAGLSKAPQFVSRGQRGGAGTVWANDADCVVVPANACGGEGTLALCRMSGRKVLLSDFMQTSFFTFVCKFLLTREESWFVRVA